MKISILNEKFPMNYLKAHTIDSLIRPVFTELIKGPFNNLPSKSKEDKNKPNPTSERIGVTLHLTNPLARLSRSETRAIAISALAEFLWYFTKDNKTAFISHYLPIYEKKYDEGGVIYGGYGPRIFKLHGSHDQLDHIVKLLANNPATRKAVIQIYDGLDIINSHKDVPCTCTLQFLLREGKLNLVTYMRSNDAYLGLPHDIFSFTMLQEVVARALEVELGDYFHSVGSLHLYCEDQNRVKEYFGEGYQESKKPMPSMPPGNQLSNIEKLLEFESRVRLNKSEQIPKVFDPYWADLARLLKTWSFLKDEDYKGILAIKDEMHSDIFDIHIEKKIDHHL